MKGKLSTLVLIIVAMAFTAPTFALDQDPLDPTTNITHGPRFVDADGDGYNDNAPDADGDGIPNGMDEDYVPAGSQNGKAGAGKWVRGRHFQNRTTEFGPNFVDADGDGVCDNYGTRAGLGKRGNGFGMRSQAAATAGRGAGQGRCGRGPRG